MEKLKELREKTGLTQKEISKNLGLTQQAYANYESSRREPDFATLKKIANYFETSIDFLVGNYSEKNENDLNNSHIVGVNISYLLEYNNIDIIQIANKWFNSEIDESRILANNISELYLNLYEWLNYGSSPTFRQVAALKTMLNTDMNLYNKDLLFFDDGIKGLGELFGIENRDIKIKNFLSKYSSKDSYSSLLMIERDVNLFLIDSVSSPYFKKNKIVPADIQLEFNIAFDILENIEDCKSHADKNRHAKWMEQFDEFCEAALDFRNRNKDKFDYETELINEVLNYLDLTSINGKPLTSYDNTYLNKVYYALLDTLKSNKMLINLIKRNGI